MAKKTKSGNTAVLKKLDEVLETELSGVTRYLHYSLMVRGPNRIPIVKFFQDQAQESFLHATIVGEKITSLGGHPSIRARPVKESGKHNVIDILRESLEHEEAALSLYREILPLCGDDIALEEMIRGFIKEEQEHIEEVHKMLDK